MEANWLIDRLKNPGLLEKGDERYLRELIASYPYFSAPYLLLAKSLKDQNHPAFDDLLPLISLQAFDRKRLFKLVHEEAKDKASAAAEKAMADREVEVTEQFHEPVSRFAVNFEEVEKEEEAAATEHEEIQEIPFLTKAESEVEVKLQEPIEVELPVSEPVEEQVIDDIIETPSLTHDPAPLDPEVKAEIEVEAEEPVSDRVHRSSVAKEQLVEEEEREVKTVTPPLTQNPEPETISQKTDFLHWLDKLAPISEKSGAFEVGVEAEVSTVAEKAVADKEEEVIEPDIRQPELAEEPEPIREEQIAIIDKFIETSPSVSRVKEKMYNPAVQAKESERLEDSLMTETMARILVKQEKFERAIDAYHKLQLKYPQKSDYFAALIEEINRKIS